MPLWVQRGCAVVAFDLSSNMDLRFYADLVCLQQMKKAHEPYVQNGKQNFSRIAVG